MRINVGAVVKTFSMLSQCVASMLLYYSVQNDLISLALANR